MSLCKQILDDGIRIVDLAHGGNSISSVMGTHHQRLGLKIGNTADAQMSVHLIDILVELRTERCILYVVNGSVVTFFFAVDCHAGTSGSQMGMIIRSKEQIKHTVFFCCDSKKSTHFRLLLSYHSVTIQSHVNIKRSPMNEVLNSFRFHKLLQQKTFIR